MGVLVARIQKVLAGICLGILHASCVISPENNIVHYNSYTTRGMLNLALSTRPRVLGHPRRNPTLIRLPAQHTCTPVLTTSSATRRRLCFQQPGARGFHYNNDDHECFLGINIRASPEISAGSYAEISMPRI